MSLCRVGGRQDLRWYSREEKHRADRCTAWQPLHVAYEQSRVGYCDEAALV